MPSPHFFTIGHSNHDLAAFSALLHCHQVTAIADVRSAPYSRRHPQFNKERLQASLQREEIAYVFLGAQLGARTRDRTCYANGRVQYDKLAATTAFQRGMDRLFAGAKAYCVALMCAEREPLDCHRTVLIARELVQRGASVAHIHGDGSLEAHDAALQRLIDLLGMAREDLLDSQQQLIAAALARQAARIAYVDESMMEPRRG